MNKHALKKILAEEGLVKVSRETQIPWADVLKAHAELERVLAKYKRYEGGTTSSPAGPDTTKFRATHSGFIQAAKYGDPSYLLLGVKIGTNWFPNPYDIIDQYAEWKVENAKREAMLEKVKADADKVLVPFMKAQGLDRVYRGPQEKSGSNYSTYGIPAQRWMKVV